MNAPISTDIIFELEAQSAQNRQWRMIFADENIDRVKAEQIAYAKWNSERPKGAGWLAFRIVKVTTTREEV